MTSASHFFQDREDRSRVGEKEKEKNEKTDDQDQEVLVLFISLGSSSLTFLQGSRAAQSSTAVRKMPKFINRFRQQKGQ